MSSESEGRIHARLNEIVKSVGEIEKDLAVVASSCRDCRPIVMGNGNDGIDKRVDRLEQRAVKRGLWFWASVAFISSVTGGIIVGVAIYLAGG